MGGWCGLAPFNPKPYLARAAAVISADCCAWDDNDAFSFTEPTPAMLRK